MQVDGIWERDGLLYNPVMARLLSRKEYYILRCSIRPDGVELLEECNGQWAGAVISWGIGASQKLSAGSVLDLSKLQDPRALRYLVIFGLYSKPIA